MTDCTNPTPGVQINTNNLPRTPGGATPVVVESSPPVPTTTTVGDESMAGSRPASKRSTFCPHGRRRSQCKECGGSQICPHGRRRYLCKECGGKGVCAHGRRRSLCTECGGAGICAHGRVRSECKECGGKSICAHGRRRSLCKECGGSQICPHGRRRTRCKECGGGSICAHGRVRSECSECGQSSKRRKRKAAAALDQRADCVPIITVAVTPIVDSALALDSIPAWAPPPPSQHLVAEAAPLRVTTDQQAEPRPGRAGAMGRAVALRAEMDRAVALRAELDRDFPSVDYAKDADLVMLKALLFAARARARDNQQHLPSQPVLFDTHDVIRRFVS